jgi:hypothetical protein
MANGGDIIIKGSSVDIDYDNNYYPTETGKRSHKNDKQTITRITLDDGASNTKYDSDTEGADVSHWNITVHCRTEP